MDTQHVREVGLGLVGRLRYDRQHPDEVDTKVHLARAAQRLARREAEEAERQQDVLRLRASSLVRSIGDLITWGSRQRDTNGMAEVTIPLLLISDPNVDTEELASEACQPIATVSARAKNPGATISSVVALRHLSVADSARVQIDYYPVVNGLTSDVAFETSSEVYDVPDPIVFSIPPTAQQVGMLDNMAARVQTMEGKFAGTYTMLDAALVTPALGYN